MRSAVTCRAKTGNRHINPTICESGSSNLRVSSSAWCNFFKVADRWRPHFRVKLLRCGTSAGANYEEADDGSSDRDSLAKKRIALRELKETKFRLRVLRRCGLLTEAQDPVITECDELVRIVATVIRNAQAKSSRDR